MSLCIDHIKEKKQIKKMAKENLTIRSPNIIYRESEDVFKQVYNTQIYKYGLIRAVWDTKHCGSS